MNAMTLLVVLTYVLTLKRAFSVAAMKDLLLRVIKEVVQVFRYIVSELCILVAVSLDIDECETNMAMCEHSCKNTNGSFNCFCDEGYVLQSNNRSCTGIIVDIIPVMYV